MILLIHPILSRSDISIVMWSSLLKIRIFNDDVDDFESEGLQKMTDLSTCVDSRNLTRQSLAELYGRIFCNISAGAIFLNQL